MNGAAKLTGANVCLPHFIIITIARIISRGNKQARLFLGSSGGGTISGAIETNRAVPNATARAFG